MTAGVHKLFMYKDLRLQSLELHCAAQILGFPQCEIFEQS